MAIRYPEILSLARADVPFSWTEKDVMLYALAVGMGTDPMDERELAFVYEKAIKVVPTFATVGVFGLSPGPMGTNPVMAVDGERKVTLHRPLPAAASVLASCKVDGVWDKGAGKGAVIATETRIRDAPTGEPIATINGAVFARGDGGFGGPQAGQPEPHAMPARAPDRSVDVATTPNQALLYRLTGDRNPLHAEPDFARRAGFDRPILHGQCTYGITCAAMLREWADYDPSRLLSHGVRFSAPVIPGDVVTIDMWKDGPVVSFEARVEARNVTVIRSGRTELRA